MKDIFRVIFIILVFFGIFMLCHFALERTEFGKFYRYFVIFCGVVLAYLVTLTDIIRPCRRKYRPTEEEHFYDTHKYCIKEVKNNINGCVEYWLMGHENYIFYEDWAPIKGPYKSLELAKEHLENLKATDGQIYTTNYIE